MRNLSKIIMAALLTSNGWIQPLFNGIEGPGFPPSPYIGTCFTNCFPQGGSEFTEANAYIRLPDGTESGYDCSTQCRYHADDPRIPLPIGFSWSTSICPPENGANIENYSYLDGGVVKVGRDSGCWRP